MASGKRLQNAETRPWFIRIEYRNKEEGDCGEAEGGSMEEEEEEEEDKFLPRSLMAEMIPE